MGAISHCSQPSGALGSSPSPTWLGRIISRCCTEIKQFGHGTIAVHNDILTIMISDLQLDLIYNIYPLPIPPWPSWLGPIIRRCCTALRQRGHGTVAVRNGSVTATTSRLRRESWKSPDRRAWYDKGNTISGQFWFIFLTYYILCS